MPQNPFVKVLFKFLRSKFRKLSPSRALPFLCRPGAKTSQPWTSPKDFPDTNFEKHDPAIPIEDLKDFSNANFQRLDPTIPIEEETLPHYAHSNYYPVRIGEVFAGRYQVIGKLGFGMSSTAWLARDVQQRHYVVLKIYLSGGRKPPELAAYERLENGPEDHPGRKAIRRLLDSFTIRGPSGKHYCLVHPPLWGSLSDWMNIQRTCICPNDPRIPPHMLAVVLRQLFLALDYTKECEIVHTDISANNVMFELEDTTVLEQIEQAELEHPLPRKEIDGRFIYQSYSIPLPRTSVCPGLPVLCDFSEARWVKEVQDPLRDKIIQPQAFRSPEVILAMQGWSYELDIWNVGCMVWWLFEAGPLFVGLDPELRNSTSPRAYLGDIVYYLGPPPHEFLDRCSLPYLKYFTPDGK